MKLNNITYYIAAAGLFTLSSCNGFLDQVPDNRVDLTTDEQLRMTLVTSYPHFNYALMTEFSSDNIEDNNAPDENGLRYNLKSYDLTDDEVFAWDRVTATSGNDTPSNVWQGFYHAIAGANAVLEKLEQKTAEQGGELNETQKAIKGEALMIRSYCHFILASIFCEAYRGPELSKAQLGIPYSEKPETTVSPAYQRGTLTETYEKIQADIEEGLPLINNGLYEVPKYHFNTSAANAFAARFYLFARNYEKALEHANAAFGGADVDASQMLTDYWKKTDQFYSLSDHGKYNQGMDKPHNFLLIATTSSFRRHIASTSRYSVIRDALNSTFHSAGPSWSRYKFVNTNGTGGTYSLNPCYSGCLYINGKSEYGIYCGATLAEQFEITDKINSTGYAHITRAEFTAEETLLVRAEAKLFLGDKAGAIADLKMWDDHRNDNYWLSTHASQNEYEPLTEANIRSFYTSDDVKKIGLVKTIHIDEVYPCEYSVNDDIEPILQCVQHFRRLETIHNGMRWFDIKRFGLEFTRKIGKNRVETLTMMDPRKANQIPNEVTASGLQPNKRVDGNNEPTLNQSTCVSTVVNKFPSVK